MPVEIIDFFPLVFVFIQNEKSSVLHAEGVEPYSQVWTSVLSTLGFSYQPFFIEVGN